MSALHSKNLKIDDLEFIKSYSGWKAYANSKLAREANFVEKAFFKIFGKSASKEAEAIVYLAESEDVRGLLENISLEKEWEEHLTNPTI